MDKYQTRDFIATRVAKEFKDGDVVNLGIGLPTMVSNFLPDDVDITFQSEKTPHPINRFLQERTQRKLNSYL